ncbi:hypothetical protein HOLleu_01477 [Holothuria leucospilota]|uniref:C2H2-type domain-containing protein n=1 Tax=Holothuria leucospilota TaxID=206669 RepID=A0A9Q1CPE1_HOLLE|nr:hypothetical protein HOLleu_01477 [Holothuria leucospilota]
MDNPQDEIGPVEGFENQIESSVGIGNITAENDMTDQSKRYPPKGTKAPNGYESPQKVRHVTGNNNQMLFMFLATNRLPSLRGRTMAPAQRQRTKSWSVTFLLRSPSYVKKSQAHLTTQPPPRTKVNPSVVAFLTQKKRVAPMTPGDSLEDGQRISETPTQCGNVFQVQAEVHVEPTTIQGSTPSEDSGCVSGSRGLKRAASPSNSDLQRGSSGSRFPIKVQRAKELLAKSHIFREVQPWFSCEAEKCQQIFSHHKDYIHHLSSFHEGQTHESSVSHQGLQGHLQQPQGMGFALS